MAESETTQLVWFKRDLRVADHRPLWEAARRGPCLCLYVYEPEVVCADDFDACHLAFVNDSLRELRERLRELGGDLVLRVGDVAEVFSRLHRRWRFHTLWAHQETGNRITFDRDRRVGEWCRENGVFFRELTQTGVVRALKDRDGWARAWQARMSQPTLRAPDGVTAVACDDPGDVRTAADLGLAPSTKTEAQPGGESVGKATLRSFLDNRGVNYRSDMASPVTGEEGCSRLSPYLAWGCLSMRQVYQATEARTRALRGRGQTGDAAGAAWLRSLTSFHGRLRWHCHFVQKFEDEPDLEFRNMNRAFDGLREDEFDESHFDAWRRGETGYPMVDACMRSLHRTGWVNFRMRAMLVSFAAYHLWLHWRRPAVYLARQFVDYEPGIHYSQFQMQSGVTGINTIRIYSPIKQARDQDPSGGFIRRWVPELAEVPLEYLAEPHRMPPLIQQDVGCVVGTDYPRPIVEHAAAYNEAKRRVYAHKRRAVVRTEARRVMQKHGSRRRSRWR